jgi:O-antigen/teichoic acid export membrane protein
MSRLPRARGGRTSPVLLGALASGLGIYLFQVVAARALDEQRLAPVAVLWTLQYLAFATLHHPGETYVAAVATRHGASSSEARLASRVVLRCSAAAGSVVGLVAWLLAPSLLSGDAGLALPAAAIVLVYGAFCVVRGMLVGQRRPGAYACATATDALLRVLLAVLVVALGATTARVAWTLPSGAAAVLLWFVIVDAPARRRDRKPDGADGAAGLTAATARLGPLSFLGASTAAALLAQTLLAGAPVLLAVTGGEPAVVSTAFLAFALARAPLVLGFGGLLALVVPFVERVRQDVVPGGGVAYAVRRFTLWTVVATAVAAVGGAVVGPTAVRVLFGAAFEPGAAVMGLVSAGSVLAGAGLLLTQAAVVLGVSRAVVLAWAGGLAVAGAVWACAPGDDLFRVAIAFAVGESTAALGLLRLARSSPG